MYYIYKKNVYFIVEMCFLFGINMFLIYKDNFKSYFFCQKIKISIFFKLIFLVIYRESRYLKIKDKNVIKIKF